MDEAFLPLHRVLAELATFPAEHVDEDAGVRTYVRAFGIASPVELDVSRDERGALRLGTVPPLYRVDTSFRPSYHHVRFEADLAEEHDG